MLKKKFIIDSLLNIISTAIPIIILQLVALPVVGHVLGDRQYGLVVTLISLFTLLSLPFGNVINNIRLLLDNEYKKNEISGDFNILLFWALIISSFIVFLGTIYYEGSISFINIFFMVLISCFNLLREYLIVSFRLKLNYKAILLNNLILGLGYLAGVGLFYLTGYWQIIFVLGTGSSLIFVTFNTSLLKEPFKKTKFFKKTAYKSIVLFISVFLKNILSYADKLLLFPLLGPVNVSIYYSATILGKMISLMITPINSVILSYLSRVKKMPLKSFIFFILLSSTVGLVGYFIITLISGPVLNLLYPDWASKSLQIIYITTASSIIGIMSSVIQPFVLKFNNINWQLIISGTNVVVYLVCVIIFYNLYGLIGFCIGILISNLIKLFLMIAIFIFNQRVINYS